MKYIILGIFLCCIIEGYSQSKDDCKNYESQSISLDSNDLYGYFYNYETIVNSDITISQFLNCLVEKANKGDKKAERTYLNHLRDIYHITKVNNISSTFFLGIIYTIKNLKPSKESFEELLYFFEDNRIYYDELLAREKKKVKIDNLTSTHFGMTVYSNYIQYKIEVNQAQDYLKIKYDFFDELRKLYVKENRDWKYFDKELHTIWYQRIKEDWETGKIKLKDAK